jgi:hypothetical protein
MEKAAAKNRYLPFILHVLAWIILVILPQFIIDRYWGSHNFFAWGFYLNAAMYGIIFYINYLWLVPKFYFGRKKAGYFMAAATVVAVLYILLLLLNNYAIHEPQRDKAIGEAFDKLVQEKVIPRPPMRQLRVYYSLLISIIVTVFALGLRLIEQHSASEKRQKELEKEKLNSELAFLKNQVSPHFFFNTLNNIYSLIEVNKADAQDAVLKLSKLMRYLLYESEHGTTSLGKEVDFMRHYIDLMKLRLSAKVDLIVDLPSDTKNNPVPPLLFIPFIENAFKHGVSYRDKSFIHIRMEAENDRITFSCINSIGQNPVSLPDENHTGIGLENVKKRLALLFPDCHSLTIEKDEKQFKVQLEILQIEEP